MKTVVISVGGSVIVPDKIDVRFVSALSNFVKESPHRFIIVTGGGKVCRWYQNVASELGASRLDEDLIGIASTRLNAELVRSCIGNIAHKDIAPMPPQKVEFSKVLIGCGYEPGHSTDTDMVLFAQAYGAQTIINMSNVDYLYDKDPKKGDAKIIHKTTWIRLLEIVGDEWEPGMNVPFDPTAVKNAMKLGLKLFLVGNDLENLKKVIDGEEFKGSVIE